MDVLSIIMSSFALIGYAISMISFIRQSKKEDAEKVKERVEIKDDLKYLRKTVDEMNKTLQNLTLASNEHGKLLAEHEVRINALERWRDSHYKG